MLIRLKVADIKCVDDPGKNWGLTFLFSEKERAFYSTLIFDKVIPTRKPTSSQGFWRG